MTRQPLPDRRPSITTTVEWEGHIFPVTIGLDPATGAPREVFADVARGGQFQWAISDACVIVSVALQHGVTAAELAKSLGRVPVLTGDEGATGPASPLGAVIEAILADVR